MVSDPEDVRQEKKSINKALHACGYPTWAIHRALQPRRLRESCETAPQGASVATTTSVSLPYVKDTTEKIQRMIKSYVIRTHMKPTKQLKDILCKPKDRLEPKDVCGSVYKIVCGGSEGEDCPADYIGETERTLKARFAEHRRPSSSSSELPKHINKDNPSHDIKLEDAQILDRDPNWFTRGIMEAFYIRAHKPTLNRDGGTTCRLSGTD